MHDLEAGEKETLKEQYQKELDLNGKLALSTMFVQHRPEQDKIHKKQVHYISIWEVNQDDGQVDCVRTIELPGKPI